MGPFYLDTNICIYALKGTFPGPEDALRARAPSSIKIASIVEAELLYGARKSKRRERTLETLRRFLDPFEVVAFDGAATKHYARIRASLERDGSPIGPNDLLLAATVLSKGGTLVTHNTREFARVEGLPLEDWTGSNDR